MWNRSASDPATGRLDAGPAEANATRWLVRSLTILRVAQLAPGPLVLATTRGVYHSEPSAVLLLVVEIGWTVALFGTALRRGWFTPSWMFADAGLQAVVAVALGRLCADGQATQSPNWSLGLVNGAAILATLFLGRSALAGVTSLLMASYLVGVGPDLATQWPNALANVGVLAAFTWAASMVGGRLLRDARSADTTSRDMATAERTRARVEARFEERTRQYRRLHDTVLSTLEGIARGGLDHAGESVRQRCGWDANLVRSMNTAVDDATELSPLPVVLAEVIHAVELFGLKVHHFTDRIPHTLPVEVVNAAAGAVREALNNVVKHAEAREAWVSTLGLPNGGILVRVVDRGVGFDPNNLGAGTGIEGSIRGRWAAVGGASAIESGPGGTMVELTWNQ